ncbi:MAG: ATPase, T2SS/T4P/T4SS family [Candidatus Hodarchaeota archaeon]
MTTCNFIESNSDFYNDHYRKIPKGSSWQLNFECNKCNKCAKRDFSDPLFTRCVFNIINNEMDEELESVSFDRRLQFTTKQVEFIKDLLLNLKHFKHFNDKLVSGLKPACEKFDKCLIHATLEPLKVLHVFSEKFLLENPLLYITKIKNLMEFFSQRKECLECMNLKARHVSKIVEIFENLSIIKALFKIHAGYDHFLQKTAFNLFNFMILDNVDKNKFMEEPIEPSVKQHVTSYDLDEAGIITVNIFSLEDQVEQLYSPTYDWPFSQPFMKMLRKDVKEEIKQDTILLKKRKLAEIIERVLNKVNQKLSNQVKLKNQEQLETLIHFITFSSVGLEKLYPFLIDDKVEEVFLDAPEGKIYLHHSDFQKCITNVSLSKEDINSLVSRVRMETNRNLNDRYPTVKCVLANRHFYIRINIDVKPLNFNNFSLDIRRLNRKVFDIIDLVGNETLPVEIAAFLIFALQTKHNITFIGRPDSGKTTLLNALDMIHPRSFRKIYVEDEIETVNQDLSRYHQLKFRVPDKRDKANVIENLLHRTPDILILGEILTKEETEAFFHCLSAGLKGMQTIHANDVKSFLTRLRIHFDIDTTCIDDMDFIVYLKKYENGARKVIELSEYIEKSNKIFINVLSLYKPKEKRWESIKIENSKSIKKFVSRTEFSVEGIRDYLEKICQVLDKNLRKFDYQREELLSELNSIYFDHIQYF